jgi:hypothetical protein
VSGGHGSWPRSGVVRRVRIGLGDRTLSALWTRWNSCTVNAGSAGPAFVTPPKLGMPKPAENLTKRIPRTLDRPHPSGMTRYVSSIALIGDISQIRR